MGGRAAIGMLHGLIPKSMRLVDCDNTLLPIESLEERLSVLRSQYASASPFPHIVVDDFLTPQAVEGVLREYPSLDSDIWFHYAHYNELTRSLNDRSQFGPVTASVVEALQSERFLRWLSALTGFSHLIADEHLESGGLQAAVRGGFLNIHADFTVHPHHRQWARRCNLLLYLNDPWPDEYGGQLELWSRDMSHAVARVAPLRNRCLIFTTDFTTYHGYPEPIQCPPTSFRKSLSLYYYTAEQTPPKIQTTDYRPRPGDGIKAIWIWLDKKALWAYDFAKRKLGISDRLASRIMKWFR